MLQCSLLPQTALYSFVSFFFVGSRFEAGMGKLGSLNRTRRKKFFSPFSNLSSPYAALKQRDRKYNRSRCCCCSSPDRQAKPTMARGSREKGSERKRRERFRWFRSHNRLTRNHCRLPHPRVCSCYRIRYSRTRRAAGRL